MTGPQHRPIATQGDQRVKFLRLNSLAQVRIIQRTGSSLSSLSAQEIGNIFCQMKRIRNDRIGQNGDLLGDGCSWDISP